MTDIYDQATEAEERYRAQALAEQAAKGQTPKGDWRKLSAMWCKGAGCGQRIDDDRRRAVPGVELCVECQAENEKEKRMRRCTTKR